MCLKKWLRAVHPGRLAVKIACVVVLGVVIVSVFTLGTASGMTKEGYVETMSRSNQQILTMVQAKMEAANDQITDVELTINNSWSFSQYLKFRQENPRAFVLVYDMAKELGAVKPATFYDVAAVGVNGQCYVTNQTSLSVPVGELLSSRVTQDARSSPNRILYRFVRKDITRNSREGSSFVALKALTYPGTRDVYGYAYVVMKQSDLRAFFDNLSNSTNNLTLLDGSGDIVSSMDRSAIGRKDEELARVVRDMDAKNETSRYVILQNKPVLVLARAIPRWNLYAVSVFDYTRALNEQNGSAYILTVCLIVTAAVLAILFFFINQITQPINKLVRTMESVTKDGLPDHIGVIRGGYEVQRLSGAFSIMIEHINRDVHRLLSLEQEKRRMEIHTLQMQINPHFIYNTLTSIKWLIWQGSAEKAVKGIDTFTLLLRSAISDSQKFLPVSEEVKNLENYIFLQKIRFGQQIQTNICVSPAAAGCLIPKLLLQPFLENSFFHAFADRQQGVVSLFIDCHGGGLVCELIDDGVGMPQGRADALVAARPDDECRSVGIPNVAARIRLLFGEKYGVKIFSEPGHGTSVRVTLPLIREGGNTT